jgi:hypothetical protein
MISTDYTNTSVALDFSHASGTRINAYFYTNNTLTTSVYNISIVGGVYTNSYLNNATDGYKLEAISEEEGLIGPLSRMFPAPSFVWNHEPEAGIWMEFENDLYNWFKDETTAYTSDAENTTLVYRNTASINEYRLAHHLSSITNGVVRLPGSFVSSTSDWSLAFMTYNTGTLNLTWAGFNIRQIGSSIVANTTFILYTFPLSDDDPQWVSVGLSYRYHDTLSVFINGIKTKEETNIPSNIVFSQDDMTIINGPIDNLILFRTLCLDDLYFAAINAFYGLPYNCPVDVTFPFVVDCPSSNNTLCINE